MKADWRGKYSKIKKQNDKADKNIGFHTVLILVVVLELFWTLKEFFADWLRSLNIFPELMITAVLFVVSLISTGAIYAAIYKNVKFLHLVRWKRKNAHKWFEGYYVHMHSKDNVRIGFVSIEQEFNSINGYGLNIDPKQTAEEICSLKKYTSWQYIFAEITSSSEDEMMNGFQAAYVAERHGSSDSKRKHGIHDLTAEKTDGAGTPLTLFGDFTDTVKDMTGDVSAHHGYLYMVRLSPESVKALLVKKNALQTLCNIQRAFAKAEAGEETLPELKQLAEKSAEIAEYRK